MYFLPLNGTLKHSQDGAFYVVCSLPQLKKFFSGYLWSNKSGSWDFPGGPVVKTPSSAGGPGPISGQGTKIPRAATREPTCTNEEPAQSDKQTNNSGSHLQAVDSGELSTA